MKKFMNGYGVVIELVKEEGNYVLYKIDNEYRDTTKDSFKNIIELNGYEEI